MKHIVKNSEPISLTKYRSTPNANFESCNKEDIRMSLIQEQGAICAYCMQRISLEWDKKLDKPKAEIEHFKSQNEFPELSLKYSNMLGVCNGNAGKPTHKQHCDKSKDSNRNKQFLPVTINPLIVDCEKKIEYKKNGKIFSKNEIINRDLDIVLNLNEPNLVKNRQNAIDFAVQSIISSIPKNRKDQTWNKADIKKELVKWKTLYNSEYLPFCQAVIYFLEKEINRK
jgi:uncharacterized protein (TIGR02646 family)